MRNGIGTKMPSTFTKKGYCTCLKARVSSICLVILDVLFEIWNMFMRRVHVPPIVDGTLLLSATELAADIRNRRRTSVSVVEDFVHRIREINPTLNCMVADRFSEALVEAREIDAILDSDPTSELVSKDSKPFLGVPFTIKDFFAVKGLPNTCGFINFKERVATADAVAVKRMRDAGAIPLGLTNVPELCMWWETNCLLWGRTRNVYDNRRIVGGSSGGEGCIISAGGSVFGVGSDIAGSVRLPGFFNGVFGHKPTRYMVPNLGQFPYDSTEDKLNCTGPICRFASDLLSTLKVLAGKENSAKMKLDQPVDPLNMGSTLKVYSCTAFNYELNQELQDAQMRVASFLASAGADVEEREFAEFRGFSEMWPAVRRSTGAPPICQFMGLPGPNAMNPFKEILLWIFGLSHHTFPAIMMGWLEWTSTSSPADWEKKSNLGQLMENDLDRLLGPYGILLCPTVMDYAYYHNQPIYRKCNHLYTMIFNIVGCPVTQVPLGLGKKGVPLGLQVVAAKYNDKLSIAIAEMIEKEFGGWVNPSTLRTSLVISLSSFTSEYTNFECYNI